MRSNSTLNSRPNSALRAFTGRFTIGAGRVRINNPDATPFFIDEASGAVAWDEDARRFRIDRLQVLAGLTHVEMQGWMAPRRPTPQRSGRRISSRATRNSVLNGRAPIRSPSSPWSPTPASSRRRHSSSSMASRRADPPSMWRSKQRPRRTAMALRSSSTSTSARAPRPISFVCGRNSSIPTYANGARKICTADGFKDR